VEADQNSKTKIISVFLGVYGSFEVSSQYLSVYSCSSVKYVIVATRDKSYELFRRAPHACLSDAFEGGKLYGVQEKIGDNEANQSL
jgi:hypothetical protein